jgi:hypothetical protein
MTKRALFIGIIGAIVFAAGGRYVNTYVPGPNMVRGHLPVSVFGLLILFTIVVNPALGGIRASWRFKGSEIALVMALLLAVSTIIDAGLMRHFPNVCIWGMHVDRTTPAWQKTRVLDYVPTFMLANDCKYSEEVVGNYISPGDPIVWPSHAWNPAAWSDPNARSAFVISVKKSWDRIPWSAWRKPLLFWGCLISLSYAAVVGLSVLIHRQWARRERIRYPLAEIISSLLVQDAGGRTLIFRNKLFWVGMVIPLVIGMLKTISLWHPDMIIIPINFDFSVLNERFPKLMQTSGSSYLATFKIFPAAVGIAFLLASDIGLSLGISNIVTVLTLFFLLQIGVDTSGGGSLEGGIVPFQNFGAYLAYSIMLIYIGRQYYWQTARSAFAFLPSPETDTAAVWGLRVFFLCVTGLVVVLIVVGLPWHIAILGIMLAMMMFFVLARLNAEAGTFFCQPSWSITMVLLCLYGFGAMGPSAYLGITLVGYILVAGSFECLMPYVVNGLKVTTDTGLKTGVVGMVVGGTVITAMCVAVSTGLWSDYQNTVSPTAGKDTTAVYDFAARNIKKLQLSSEFEAAKGYTSWERLAHARPDRRFLTWTAVGFVLIFALSAARLRWAWWPLHPVILLTFGSILMVGRYGASLLLGWFIKVFILKLAGPTTYSSVKPFMIGVIAGDILSGFITMCVLRGYYLITGVNGPSWQFFT